MSGAHQNAPVSPDFISLILIETFFIHILPVSNENENARRTLFVSYWLQLQLT
jgi:hypothetical protein